MKNILAIVCLLLVSVTHYAFGQTISEINYAFGISKTSPAVQSRYWDEPIPAYLKLNITKSWYSNNHRISLRKEVGVNLQYAKVSLTSGGLGGRGYLSGNIISLFADAALMANIRITHSLAFSAGPEVEFLALGKNHLNYSYSMYYQNPPCSGERRLDGINRDYFQEPSYGIRMRLYESGITDRAAIGIGASYLWTKDLNSNFYADNYKRISLFIGFKKKKKEVTVDPQN